MTAFATSGNFLRAKSFSRLQEDFAEFQRATEQLFASLEPLRQTATTETASAQLPSIDLDLRNAPPEVLAAAKLQFSPLEVQAASQCVVDAGDFSFAKPRPIRLKRPSSRSSQHSHGDGSKAQPERGRHQMHTP